MQLLLGMVVGNGYIPDHPFGIGTFRDRNREILRTIGRQDGATITVGLFEEMLAQFNPHLVVVY